MECGARKRVIASTIQQPISPRRQYGLPKTQARAVSTGEDWNLIDKNIRNGEFGRVVTSITRIVKESNLIFQNASLASTPLRSANASDYGSRKLEVRSKSNRDLSLQRRYANERSTIDQKL